MCVKPVFSKFNILDECKSLQFLHVFLPLLAVSNSVCAGFMYWGKKGKKEEEAKVRYFDILYTDTQTTLKDIKICRHQ